MNKVLHHSFPTKILCQKFFVPELKEKNEEIQPVILLLSFL